MGLLVDFEFRMGFGSVCGGCVFSVMVALSYTTACVVCRILATALFGRGVLDIWQVPVSRNGGVTKLKATFGSGWFSMW